MWLVARRAGSLRIKEEGLTPQKNSNSSSSAQAHHAAAPAPASPATQPDESLTYHTPRNSFRTRSCFSPSFPTTKKTRQAPVGAVWQAGAVQPRLQRLCSRPCCTSLPPCLHAPFQSFFPALLTPVAGPLVSGCASLLLSSCGNLPAAQQAAAWPADHPARSLWGRRRPPPLPPRIHLLFARSRHAPAATLQPPHACSPA